MTNRRYHVIMLFASGAVVAYLCRNSLGVAEKTIRADLGISEAAMGLILGPAFFWTYALAQIPTGWLGSRWGARRLVPWLAAGWSAGTMALGVGLGSPWILTMRGVTGVSQAGLFPCATLSYSYWLTATERAMGSGMLASSMSIGGAIGVGLTGLLIDNGVSWRVVFACYGAVSLAWAVAFRWSFRNTPQEDQRVSKEELALICGSLSKAAVPRPEEAAERTPWLTLLLSPPLWWICSQQFFRAAGAVFFASWFPTWLQETRGVSTAESGFLSMLPLIAIVVAAVLGGVLSDWILRRTGSLRLARQGVAIFCLTLCALLVASALWVRSPQLAVLVISFGVFWAGFIGPCAYAITIDMGSRHVPVVFGSMNMVGNFGAGLLPWVVPHFRQLLVEHPQWLPGGVSSWDAVLLLFAGCYLLAALSWVMLNPRGTIVENSLWNRSDEQPSV